VAGFKVSDRIAGVGAFMRCSTDHHNVLVLAAPVNFLHHTSWQTSRARGGCSPGGAPAPFFLHPEDLAAMMTGAHAR
jgi:hypothetical protein